MYLQSLSLMYLDVDVNNDSSLFIHYKFLLLFLKDVDWGAKLVLATLYHPTSLPNDDNNGGNDAKTCSGSMNGELCGDNDPISMGEQTKAITRPQSQAFSDDKSEDDLQLRCVSKYGGKFRSSQAGRNGMRDHKKLRLTDDNDDYDDDGARNDINRKTNNLNKHLSHGVLQSDSQTVTINNVSNSNMSNKAANTIHNMRFDINNHNNTNSFQNNDFSDSSDDDTNDDDEYIEATPPHKRALGMQ